jgi:hypothetical protein
MELAFEVSDEIEAFVQSQLKAWRAELRRLSLDPRMSRFRRVRERIEAADPLPAKPKPRPIPDRSDLFDPYDAFELARDLAGRVVPPGELSRLMQRRFTDMSVEGRRWMIRFLVENGVAEVVRRTAAGRPSDYRFGPPMNGGTLGKEKGFDAPDSGIARLKREDLEDVVVRVLPRPERSPAAGGGPVPSPRSSSPTG